jgi:sorting nexin-1/2
MPGGAEAAARGASTTALALGVGGTLDVMVTAPSKVGDGMGAHATYTVTTITDLVGFKAGAASVARRFSDFTWLRGRLHASFPGVILYPLPEKVVTTSPFNPEFLEHRRAGLDVFMRKTCAHPALRHADDLKLFLEAAGPGGSGGGSGGGGGGGSGLGGGTAWYQRGAAGTALGAVDSWWQQIATATESFVAGAGVDTMLMEEDPRRGGFRGHGPGFGVSGLQV